MQYNYGVFIGRFQPFHEGHARVVQEALFSCEKVIILLGSAYSARSVRNPWTWEERAEMIKTRFPKDLDRVVFYPLEDKTYRDNEWVESVQGIVNSEIEFDGWRNKPATVALVGSKKDETGYYLDMFPMWASHPVNHRVPYNSTQIREALFGRGDESAKGWVDLAVQRVIEPDLSKPWFFDMRDEIAHIEKEYKEPYKHLKFKPIFTTVDSLVVTSGHLLLVERGKRPGKGLLALPGGYLNAEEFIADGTLRELREETKIDVSDTRLRAAKVRERVFDDPNRSPRGRLVTHATLFQLPNERKLPKVKGSDDAAKAFWLPIYDLDSTKMFEDHYHIIRSLLK